MTSEIDRTKDPVANSSLPAKARLFVAHALIDSATVLSPATIDVDAGTITNLQQGHVDPGGDVDRVRIDWSQYLLCPAFVNAHTHLDLSHVKRPAEPRDFADWLLQVLGSRTAAPESIESATVAQVERIASSSTGYVGDISSNGQSSNYLLNHRMAGTVFHEVIGQKEARYQATFATSQARLASSSAGDLMHSLSPHAPFSTNRAAYQACARALAGRKTNRQRADNNSGGALSDSTATASVLATHWFETLEELEFLTTGAGPIRSFLDLIGALDAPPQTESTDAWLEWLLSLAVDRLALVHGNYLSTDHINRLAQQNDQSGSSAVGVIYCPRTHAYFNHTKHPVNELLDAGVPVALGTDSLASNPDLDVLVEAQFLRQARSDLTLGTLFDMLTRHGGLVLGLGESFGSLRIGQPIRANVFNLHLEGNAPQGSRSTELLIEAILDPSTEFVGQCRG